MAYRGQTSAIQALSSLYHTLPVDIVLGEIEPDWYQERRIALDQEYGLEEETDLSIRKKRQEHNYIIQRTRLEMLRVGQVVDGTVRRIKPYGLFVDIGGHPALLYISEISQMPVEQLDQFFSYGNWIRAMILWIDIEKGRISLSTSCLEVEPGDMLIHPWKVYETAEEMAARYYQNVLSKLNLE